MFDAAIHGEKNIVAAGLGQAQQFPIFLSGESCFGSGAAFMTGQVFLKFAGQALVEENPHPSSATRSDLACSRAAMAYSRETVGKSSRNSSRDSPPSR